MRGIVFICTLVCVFLTVSATGQSKVLFKVKNVQLQKGEKVGLRGSLMPLQWDKSIPLEKQGAYYVVEVDFGPLNETLEFKFVTFDQNDKASWETNSNRQIELKAGEQTSESIWDTEQYIDPTTLTPIPVEGLQQDLILIEKMVRDIHPGTYRYLDSAGVDDMLAELKLSFQKPLTHGEAYLTINKALTQLRCGHTFASLYNQNTVIQSVIHLGQDKLPFAFRWIEGKMVVTHDATPQESIPRGSVIASINGVNTSAIVDRLLPYIARDGNTPHHQLARLEILGYDFQYDAFDSFYALLFPLASEVTIVMINPAGEKVTVQAPLMSRFDRNQIFQSRYSDFPKTADDHWNFEVMDRNTGVLTLNSFSLMGWKSMTLDYRRYLDSVFTVVKSQGIENLIIDTRLNNGGNDEILAELITYFDVNRVKFEDIEGRTRYLKYPDEMKSHTRSWGSKDPWYYQLKANRQSDGYFHFPEDGKVNRKNRKKPNYFTGRVYLLTSPHNASLAFYTARSFRLLDIGEIVGEQTGGNLRGVNGGQIVFLTLPNSGITIDFPVMGMFSVVDQPDQGIIPDHLVSTSYADFLKGVDTQKQYVLEQLIGKQGE